MRGVLVLIAVLLLPCGAARANDASYGGDASRVFPLLHTRVVMEAEEIVIEPSGREART